MDSCHIMDRSPAAGSCPLPPAWWTACTHPPTRPALPLPLHVPAPTICGRTAALNWSGLISLGGTWASHSPGHWFTLSGTHSPPAPRDLLSLLLSHGPVRFPENQSRFLSEFAAVSLECVPLFNTITPVLFPAPLFYLYKSLFLAFNKCQMLFQKKASLPWYSI